MAYQPLARKYRPQTFADLVGQDSVSTALSNALKLGREPHAVIFAGVRGIGKTTTARLYAKALNCEQGPTPTPCGTCESCRAIEFGTHEDVLEIDGASNTSVDDVRSLRETVAYIPQRSKYKIYIIDEVHMLSQSAFNALLKTLEEPPTHVVFVFATTELQKIPQTILSRCQTFHLRKFSLENLVNRIKLILDSEKICYEDDALTWVARQGRGSMRDALTTLDQIIAFGGGAVDKQSLVAVLKSIPVSQYINLLSALLKKDAPLCFAAIETLLGANSSISEHVEELAALCRHAFVIKDLGTKSLDTALLGLESDVVKELEILAQQAQTLDLNRLFRTLSKCLQDLDGSSLDRYVFENYCFEWTLDPGLPNLEDLQQFVAGSRSQTSNIAHTAAAPAAKVERKPLNLRKDMPEENKVAAVNTEAVKTPAPVTTTPAPTIRKMPDTWRELVNAWKSSKPLQARILEEAYLLKYAPDEILLRVNPDSLAAAKLLQPQVLSKVNEGFREMFGFNGTLRIDTRVEGAAASQDGAPSKTPAAPSENLLDIKAREKDIERQRLIQEATKSPTTQVVLDTFNVKIEKVTLDT